MANRPIVNFDELELTQQRRSARFDAATARLGPVIGMDQLGAQLHLVAPGKAAWPRHAHHANEELFIILDGAGEYQEGDKVWPIRKGDVIAAPAGFADTAHQVRNTGSEPMHYLAVSTNHAVDLIEYPDSGKRWVASGITQESGLTGATLSYIWHESNPATDYWSGEVED